MECQIKTKILKKMKKAKIKLKYLAMTYQINILLRKWLPSIKIFKIIPFRMKINVFQYIIKYWKKYFNAITITKEQIELIKKFNVYARKIKIL